MKNRKSLELKRKVLQVLEKPYSRILIPQEEGGFSAEIMEFPGCFAEGESTEETYRSLEAAARAWVQSCLEKGDPIPDPLTNYEASGKFALRLPRSLYLRASRAAAKDRVSLNQFITSAVAERVGGAEIESRLGKLFDRFLSLLRMDYRSSKGVEIRPDVDWIQQGFGEYQEQDTIH